MDAILVPGGFGKRGVEGKIGAIRYARENKVPYLGICLGMQLAVIEFARNMAGLEGAHSTEFDPDTPHPVVALITEWHGPRRQGRAARRRLRPGRHHAPGRAGRAARCPAPWRGRSTARKRSTSATAIATRSTTTTSRTRERRAARVAALRHRGPCRDDRAARSSLVRRLPVPPGVHLHAPRTAIRCSRPSSAPRSPAAGAAGWRPSATARQPPVAKTSCQHRDIA